MWSRRFEPLSDDRLRAAARSPAADRRRPARRCRRAVPAGSMPTPRSRTVVDEPVLEVGVEAVLRLARLQVEEAEHQRAGEAEQRGRERDAHAAQRRGEAFLQRVEHRAGVAARLERLDHARRPSRRSRSGPRTCRAGRGRSAARSCSATCRAPRRGGWRSNRGCRASSVDEIDMRPMRSPRSAAIGASSTGGRSTARPGSARRKPLTQRDLGKQPDHLPERQQDADHQNADDQRVEPRIGDEAPSRSAGRGRRRRARTGSGTPSSGTERSGATKA